MIPINPNVDEGHPLSKALLHVAQQVEVFKTAYTHYTKDINGNPLLLSGVPHLTQTHSTIMITHPDIADIIMKQIHLLNNPNDWDYLLYLSCTDAGSHINNLIPATGETLLNVKIDLLKATMNKKTLLLHAADEDLLSTAKLIHSVSLKETLHTITFTAPTRPADAAVKLFGSVNYYETPLFQELKNGTLLIKNVHYLDTVTQSYLVEYITSGWYRLFETEHKMISNVRIICSTNQILSELVQAGKFLPELYALLKKQTIIIPSLFELSSQEIDNLITGFSEALINSYTMKNIFALTEKEKQKITDQLPSSLHELKHRVEQMTLKKTDQSSFENIMAIGNPSNDPLLEQAARLGKQALKDQRLLALLWKRFKNQNKIALFLGVNRSSVNRRFKTFHINENSEVIA